MKQLGDRRLRELEPHDVSTDVKSQAIPLKMILESKRDGRMNGRGIRRGDLEPKEWDIKNIDSPVVPLWLAWHA